VIGFIHFLGELRCLGKRFEIILNGVSIRFMMCLDRNDLYTRSRWDGAAGTSRHSLLQALQRGLTVKQVAVDDRSDASTWYTHEGFIAPGVMIPPRRLQTIFDQAAWYQRTLCTYHTGSHEYSLLWDHQCARRHFPTVTTHILAEHTNEVWVVEWSNNGKYLASGSADNTVIVWKVGVSASMPGLTTTESNSD
jgi:WD40 repeat protein